MSCDSVAKLIPFYFYGELPPGDEEAVEDHLHSCAVCSGEMERQRRMAAALDRQVAEPPPFLQEECRADLMAAIENSPAASPAPAIRRPKPKGPWALFVEAMEAAFSGLGRLRQPIAAMALIAVGFLAARFTGLNPGVAQKPPTSSPPDEVYAAVRSVQPDPSGVVRISFDETRRREISGRVDSPSIQKLLLAAAREDNAAVRQESLDVLNRQCANSTEVRDALLNTLVNDPAAPVRMKALEGLKPLAGDPRVRATLVRVLQADNSDPLRMQAVDLLAAHPDDSIVGIFQGLVPRERDPYVRMKTEKALKDWNASIGTF